MEALNLKFYDVLNQWVVQQPALLVVLDGEVANILVSSEKRASALIARSGEMRMRDFFPQTLEDETMKRKPNEPRKNPGSLIYEWMVLSDEDVFLTIIHTVMT